MKKRNSRQGRQGEALPNEKQKVRKRRKRVELNARQLRTVYALRLKPCWREEIDRIAGASNGPEVISQLRKLGFVIDCIRVPKLDRDGKSCRPGRYYLRSEPEEIA